MTLCVFQCFFGWWLESFLFLSFLQDIHICLHIFTFYRREESAQQWPGYIHKIPSLSVSPLVFVITNFSINKMQCIEQKRKKNELNRKSLVLCMLLFALHLSQQTGREDGHSFCSLLFRYVNVERVFNIKVNINTSIYCSICELHTSPSLICWENVGEKSCVKCHTHTHQGVYNAHTLTHIYTR